MAPTFTVVTPTRRRLPLLRQAVASVLAQSEPDVELVVSDNASDDGTREWVLAQEDERLRYVAPDRVLNAHDHWDFALGHARGEWVMILPDDDGLVPTALERVRSVLDDAPRAVAWREATYSHTVAPVRSLPPEELNQAVVDPFTGRVSDIDCREELHALFARRETGPAPGLAAGVMHRDAVERIRRTLGHVFSGPDPFIRAAVAYMALEATYRVVDLPLNLRGLTAASISLSFTRNERGGHDVVTEFDTEDLLTMVPTRARTATNVIAESLLRSKVALPHHLAGVEHDLVRYFLVARQELDDPHRGDDGGVALAEWRAAVHAQRPTVRAAVVASRSAEQARRRAIAAAHRAAASVPGARRLRKAVRAGIEGRSELVVLAGRDHDFEDLAGAARAVDALLPATRVQRSEVAELAAAT
ncbi:MAG TPA: glycosyltransferase family A protein [Acidimicrobiia bacterium]|nr:glycosyltransferase family A protein [Acidimicrobiia bacterium]